MSLLRFSPAVLITLRAADATAKLTATSSAPADTSPFPPGSFLVDAVAFLAIAGCVLAAFKVYTAIRGGKLGQGWVWLVLGLAVLGLAQLWLVAEQVGLMPVWVIWVDMLRLVSLALLFIGISRIRRLLA
ncbi:MAG: hypothetical protein HY304_08595 [candidate division Zixibacteria bacterium]|nr:hypothetical protein [candidate division Zixibacteria bacterium]